LYHRPDEMNGTQSHNKMSEAEVEKLTAMISKMARTKTIDSATEGKLYEKVWACIRTCTGHTGDIDSAINSRLYEKRHIRAQAVALCR
jgi:hypothetical protein